MKTSLLFIILFLFYGCRDRNIIEEEKFVIIYSDLLIATDSTTVDSAKTGVFKRYDISGEKYEKTVEYYNSNPQKWEEFFNKVIAHIEDLKKDTSSVL